MTTRSHFNFGEDPDANLADEREAKRKMFSLLKVCVFLSAVLILPAMELKVMFRSVMMSP